MTVGSLLLWATTRRLVAEQESEILEHRTDQIRDGFLTRLGSVLNTLSTLGTSLDGNTDPRQVEDSLRSVLRPAMLNNVALVDTTTEPPRVVAGAGGPAPGQPLSPDAAAAVADLDPTRPLVTTDVLGTGDNRHLGFAQGPPLAPPGHALYGELALRSFDPAAAHAVLGEPADVDSVLYSRTDPSLDSVLFATTGTLPFPGPVASREIPVGTSTWLLQTHPRETLVSGLGRMVPLMVLGGGLAAAVLVTLVVELAARRRDDALALAEAKAEESESILDAAREAFVTIDGDGRVSEWSVQAERLVGWTAAEAVGLPVIDTFVPEDRRDRYREALEALRRADAEAGAAEGARRFETDVVARDGRRFPVEICLWRPARGPWLAHGIIHDISDRRRIADDLAAAHRRALEASRLKSEFVATMSHEIRTPMNAVIGMTGLLLRTPLDEEQREYAETVRSSAESLLTVINDILDFSKVEAGRIELEEIDFDVRSSVEEVADLLAEGARSKGIELITAVEADVPPLVKGDPGRLRQILVNLAGNAVKFTEEGEVVIHCSVADPPRAHRPLRLRFEVRDTGCGIAADHLEGIFDSFTQADSSTTRRFGGTGLGLAIARQLTELMGGQIGVESELGRGATFWFTAEMETTAVEPVTDEAARVLDRARVLVVDANASNRGALSAAVAGWGAVTGEAAATDEAADALRRAGAHGEPYDLVLVDHQPPGADGCAVADRLQPLTRPAGVPIILLTHPTDELDPARLAAAGITATLTKPVHRDVLRERVVAALLARPHKAGAGVRGDGAAPEPAVAVPPAARAAPVAPPVADESVPPGMRVLVAEDNPVNQRVARRMLEKLGCEVEVVENGALAVDATLAGDYAVVFMDCQMPEMDGYEATREIRRREPPGRRTPVVAMTAAVMTGDRERTAEAGMDDFVAKPVRLPDLTAALVRWSPGPPTVDMRVPAAPIDLAAVEELRAAGGRDDSGLTGLADEFATGAAEQLRALEDAVARGDLELVARGDLELVARGAHRLRGATATFGAVEATAAAEELERVARAGDPEPVGPALDRLADAVTRATVEVNRLVGRG